MSSAMTVSVMAEAVARWIKPWPAHALQDSQPGRSDRSAQLNRTAAKPHIAPGVRCRSIPPLPTSQGKKIPTILKDRSEKSAKVYLLPYYRLMLGNDHSAR
jgi:hypothetical protein